MYRADPTRRPTCHASRAGVIDRSDEEVRELFSDAEFPRFTSTTIASPEELLSVLARIR